MFETLGLENWTPQQASVVAGLAIGLLFGILAQTVRFCLRRGLVGAPEDRRPALAVWLTAFAVAGLATTAFAAQGFLSFEDHRFHAAGVPVAAIVLGGLLFGAGMVLARGCASRLTVLSGTGNIRAFVAIVAFALVAHATLKGVLAPARVWVSGYSLDLPSVTLPGSPWIWSIGIALAVAAFVLRSGAKPLQILLGALIGLLVSVGWGVTGFVLFDEFDPIALESLAFTSSASETLFWTVAGTAVAPAFGVGFFGGTLAGAALSATFRREFRPTGFTQELTASRYILGGSLMGVGGVLAGGCTVGAGLTGTSTLSVAAFLALASIVAGALATKSLTTSKDIGLVPAE